MKVLREKKCLQAEKPAFTLDPITVVVDKDSRIYGSGSDPKPYHLRMKWCSYDVEATGSVHLDAAMREEPTWGFHFRPKAAIGYVPSEALEKTWIDGVDGGLLIEPFYWRSLNLNAQVGVRSFGVGLGLDVVRNVSLYFGYALVYRTWASSPYLGMGFHLW
jgi:hypothetical protein